MKTLLTSLFIVLSKIIFGQFAQYEQLLTPYLSKPIESGFFYLNTPNNFQAGTLYQIYRQSAPDLNNNMVLIDHHIDSLAGLNHYKYQQTFMDIPIEGAGCIEHYDKNGSLLFINAKIAFSIKSSAEPKITSKDAINKVIYYLKQDPKIKFAWENPEWEQQIRKDHADSSATWYPTSELIFAIDTMKNMNLVIDGNRYYLAYKISITTISPTFETFYYYVNALNGMILKIRSSHIDVSGDVYGYGNRNLDTKWRGGLIQKYELDAEDSPHNFHTKKWAGFFTTWDNMADARSSSTNWGNTYLTETSTHFHVGNTWDYFYNTFGRNGMDGQGGEVRIKTQWSDNNAYYDHQIIPNELVFGKTPAAWDLGMEPSIVGHEFTHGITNYTAALEYEYESGALNESFSDIFGTVIQSKTLDFGNTDWILGNHIPNSLVLTRSLIDPNTRGQHWNGNYDANGNMILDIGQPEYYQGTFWCFNCPGDLGGVHINSGVQNKWFQSLSDGESGPSVTGIGMTKAAKIAYYALTSILMSSSQYSDSKEATITAAIILYGECSQEHISTVDAWNHVGVNASYNCITNSTDDINENIEIYIYPNPSSKSIFVELPKISKSPIQIFDINGRLINEIKSSDLHFQIDISHLQSGVYLFKFDFNGDTKIKRIIVE
jgi:Zn-dependent metalloprotease